MISYHNDLTIRFDHTPVIHKSAFQINQVGVDDPYVFPVVDYTATDDNTIWLDSDSVVTSTGDYDAPYTTLVAAINATNSTRSKVCALNDAIYNEDITGCTYTYLQGIYNTSTGTASWVGRQLGYVPSDANSIFVSATTGNDTTGDGSQATPYATIGKGASECDASHQKVVILDSETYVEDGFTFTGNFQGLYAAIGQAPVLQLDNPDITVGVFSNVTVDGNNNHAIPATYPYNGNLPYEHSIVLVNGNVIILYRDGGDGGKLKYKIVSKSGASVLAATTVCTNDVRALNMTLLENGNIAIVYRKTASPYYFFYAVYGQDGSAIKSETQLSTTIADDEYYVVSKLYDSGFVVSYYSTAGGNHGEFKIFTDAGALVTTVSTATTSAYWGLCVVPLKSVGRFVLAQISTGGISTQGYYCIYSNTGTLVKDWTLIHGPYYYSHAIEIPCGVSFDDGSFCLSWRDGKSGNPYEDEPFYGIWDADGDVVKSPDLVHTYTQVSYIDVIRTTNDNATIAIVQSADTDKVEFAYYSNLGVYISSETAYAASPDGTAVALVSIQDNAILIYQKKNASTLGQHNFFSEMLFYAMQNDVAGGIVINGITVDEDDIEGLYSFVYGDNPLTIQWCEFRNGTPETINSSAYVVAGELTAMQNCKCWNCNNGIGTTMSSVSVTDTQFYWITDGYAIDNDGAAASEGDITIEHCDIFDSYGGIHLENNDGDNETLKNNIIHDCDVYAIDAETDITVNNTVYTGSVTGVTVGDYFTNANPQYLNGGYNNPDDIDLNIKVKVLGYPINSPALNLADDTRNAGAIDVKYIGTETTWTSITLPKPQIIPIQGTFAGSTNTQRADGSYSSYKSAQSEIVTMRWTALSTADFELLKTMWMSSTATVRIYPDPVTYPNSYATYTLLRNALNMGTVFVTVSSWGVQTVELTFAKAL